MLVLLTRGDYSDYGIHSLREVPEVEAKRLIAARGAVKQAMAASKCPSLDYDNANDAMARARYYTELAAYQKTNWALMAEHEALWQQFLAFPEVTFVEERSNY